MVSPYVLREKWPSFSHDSVCGLCGRPKPCRYSPDGSVVMCVRVSAGAFKEKNGWYFHRVGESRPRAHAQGRVLYVAPSPVRKDLADLVAAYQHTVLDGWLEEFAEAEGLKVDALRRLGIGLAFDQGRAAGADAGDVLRTPPDARCWTLPMRDGDHNVVGLLRRWGTGEKKTLLGSHLGLFIPTGLQSGEPLLLAEGATDTAAALGLGFESVGRPSSGAGADDLVRLVRKLNPADVVVFSDVDSHYVGQRGARQVASRLAVYTRRLRITCAPPPFKDLRQWVKAGATAADVQGVIDAAPECDVRLGGAR